MGGYTAFGIAAAHPGFARAFAFVSTTAAPEDEGGKHRRAAAIAMIRQSGWRAYADALIPSLLNDNRPQFPTASRASAGDVRARRRLRLAVDPHGVGGSPRPARLLMTLHLPTTVIVGAVDALISPDLARARSPRAFPAHACTCWTTSRT